MIHKSPCQIYHSALPLCPPSSWLHECYAAELSQAFKVVRGLPGDWGTYSRTVLFDQTPQTLSCGNNTIAVGLESGDIIILDAITGSQAAVLSGHRGQVASLAFSPGGTSLVSGSEDKTVKLWDMQTGGVVKTLYDHTGSVTSVSISSDCTRIAAGSDDETICLWDIQTGECKRTIKQQDIVYDVIFSPIDPGHIIFTCGGKIYQLDTSGHQTSHAYSGDDIFFSPDHTQFALCDGAVVTVQNSDSRAIVAEWNTASNGNISYPCFSPDGRFVAGASGKIIYVWDITSSDPCLVESCIGHTGYVHSLVFSSSCCLISASDDKSVRFWQIGVLSTDPVATSPESALFTSALIRSISLQARDGIAISSDSAGVVKTWDISTGLCNASFQTPAKIGSQRYAKLADGSFRKQGFADGTWRDAQLVDGKLIFIWHNGSKICVWDNRKGEYLQTVDTPCSSGLRISGDGSKIFCLGDCVLQAWEMWTWEYVDEVKLEGRIAYLDSFCPGGSKIWVQYQNSSTQGWDFGTSGSPPVPLSKTFTERPHLDFIGGFLRETGNPSWIKNTITGRRVFQLSGRYAGFCNVQWDGQYLVAGYEYGEVVILDFNGLGSQ